MSICTLAGPSDSSPRREAWERDLLQGPTPLLRLQYRNRDQESQCPAGSLLRVHAGSREPAESEAARKTSQRQRASPLHPAPNFGPGVPAGSRITTRAPAHRVGFPKISDFSGVAVRAPRATERRGHHACLKHCLTESQECTRITKMLFVSLVLFCR